MTSEFHEGDRAAIEYTNTHGTESTLVGEVVHVNDPESVDAYSYLVMDDEDWDRFVVASRRFKFVRAVDEFDGSVNPRSAGREIGEFRQMYEIGPGFTSVDRFVDGVEDGDRVRLVYETSDGDEKAIEGFVDDADNSERTIVEWGSTVYLVYSDGESEVAREKSGRTHTVGTFASATVLGDSGRAHDGGKRT